jgi:hypothetical protein
MLYAAIIGVIMGLGGADTITAVLMAVGLVAYRAVVDVVLKRSLITGIESDYVAYVANLRAQGDDNPRPWISYIAYSASLLPPITIICYFFSRWIFRH